MKQIIVFAADQLIPVSLLVDVVSRVFQFMKRVYSFVRDTIFPDGSFDWRHAKDEFFRHYFAYYQEEFVDFDKHPELRGLMVIP